MDLELPLPSHAGSLRPWRPHGIAARAAIIIATIAVSSLAAEDEGGPPSPQEATFAAHVLPILERRCAGCHGGEDAKGDLSVESLETLLAGGKKGPPIVPGKPEESLLYQLVSGVKKPLMPPRKAEPLSEAEVLTFRAWIAGGAKAGAIETPPEPYATPPEASRYPRPPVIAALAYTPDGGTLLAGGYREVLVHRTAALHAGVPQESGPVSVEPVRRLTGEAERIQALATSEDGRLVYVAGGSPGRFGELQVWELDSAKLASFRRIGKDVLYALDLSDDGTRLLAAGAGRAIHLLDAASLEVLGVLEVHADWVFGAAFAPGGDRTVSGGRDRTLKVADVERGTVLQTLAVFPDSISRVLVRPGGAQVLAAAETGEARVYDLQELKEVRKLENQPFPVLAAAFSRDGALAALGGAGREVRVYRSEDGQRIALLDAGPEWTFSLAFHPAREELAAAGYDGAVRIFDLKEKRKIAEVIPVTLEAPGAR